MHDIALLNETKLLVVLAYLLLFNGALPYGPFEVLNFNATVASVGLEPPIGRAEAAVIDLAGEALVCRWLGVAHSGQGTKCN